MNTYFLTNRQIVWLIRLCFSIKCRKNDLVRVCCSYILKRKNAFTGNRIKTKLSDKVNLNITA